MKIYEEILTNYLYFTIDNRHYMSYNNNCEREKQSKYCGGIRCIYSREAAKKCHLTNLRLL